MARDAPSIDAFGDGGFRLSGVWRPGSVLILADEAHDWPVRTISDLTPEAIVAVTAAGRAQSELLLLGMGARNALPSRALRDAVQDAGLGLEFMDTPAAARLYNLLTSEGRRLAAALIAV
ncbi:MAG: Mth938-like domain-containing protein [Phenylobacterium sp.]